MKENVESTNPHNDKSATGLPGRTLLHPDDVLADTSMSRADKKALLASWASDVHAVKDAPGCRQLDSGAIVEVDDILRALKSLDGASLSDKRPAERVPYYLRRSAWLSRWRNGRGRRHGPDDDNHPPPPCPAAAYRPARASIPEQALGMRLA